ncbi:hypothetical protein [Streptomyces sp. NPDC054849]
MVTKDLLPCAFLPVPGNPVAGCPQSAVRRRPAAGPAGPAGRSTQDAVGKVEAEVGVCRSRSAFESTAERLAGAFHATSPDRRRLVDLHPSGRSHLADPVTVLQSTGHVLICSGVRRDV